MQNKEAVRELEGHTAEKPSVLPLVPATCLFCDSSWRGGCQLPGKPFPKVGLRVFYSCGSSLSVWCDLGHGSVHLLAKNCMTKNEE